jgi:uncharacterized protein YcbX
MISVSELNIYPVKSLAGLGLQSVSLDRFGFTGDRRWMVVNEKRRFLSQREIEAMALISVELTQEGIRLAARVGAVSVPQPSPAARSVRVQVWEDSVNALDAGDEAARWLSEVLAADCRLVYMGEDAQRYVDGVYAREGETVSFADGFPVLLISQASLDDLNSRLSQPVPMNRFRPNLVVQGCEAYAEDNWRSIQIGAMILDVAKPCSRCVMPSIDQATAQKDGEILRVLAGYRRGADRQTYFGQNLLYTGSGELRLGDAVQVLKTRD